MEFRVGWKGILIFAFLIVVVAGGMTQIFPAWKDSSPVNIEVPEDVGGIMRLSWKPHEDATEYMVYEFQSFLAVPTVIYSGEETTYNFTKDFEGYRFYVVAYTGEGDQEGIPTIIGLVTTSGGSNPFSGLLESPVYSGFTGGRDLDMYDIKGFISLEFFSWFWMLAGVFIAYLAVATITNDFEDKRMDLIFSTPISRRRYILEKFLAMSLISLFLIMMGVLGLYSGVESIGASGDFPPEKVFYSLLGSVPFLMFIAAFGILVAVVFRRTKTGIGITIAFLFGEFFAFTFAGLSEHIEWMKSLSIMNYWDYLSVIFDDVFQIGGFIGLLLGSLVLIGLAIFVFERKDIPT